MTINTFVAGNPGSLRESADSMRGQAARTERYAGAWHHTRAGAEPEWHGHASDNYQHYATRQGRSGDDAERALDDYARALDDLADSLDAVKARMHQAEDVATKGGLLVLTPAIHPPALKASSSIPALPLSPEEDQQAQADLHRQEQAHREAQAIVREAREMERVAHERQTAADNTLTDALGAIPQHGEWEQMAATASISPAAVALSKAATDLETRSSNATRAQFEKAAAGGPFAVRGLWGSMTSAQRAEMTSHFPKLVGATNGVPVTARDQANRRLLTEQRTALESALGRAANPMTNGKRVTGSQLGRVDSLKKALAGLDDLEAQLNDPNGHKYLLGLKSTASGRGQAIVASGNPDTADNVVTTVPGTGSDLSNASTYVNETDKLVGRAQQFSDGSVAGVSWLNYESPPDLVSADLNHFADDSRQDLADFQHGLSATHHGEPANRTLVGHSYGTPLVGEAARDHHGIADNLVFVGSPGVGVDHSDQLGVPPDHVYSGTAGDDQIKLSRFVTPGHYFPWKDGLQLPFGISPSDPHFGAQQIPTDPDAGHPDYWERESSLDGMARVVAGKGNG